MTDVNDLSISLIAIDPGSVSVANGGNGSNGGSTTWNGLTVGDGFAVSGRNLTSLSTRGGVTIDWLAGVLLDEATISTGGGQVSIAGRRNSASTSYGAGFINYSGTNDLFSLGFEVSGLTPTGVAMSSIAPTVQNLWHLGVGTVFQREGTKRDFKSGGSSNSLMNAGFKNATGGNAQVADYQGAAGLWLRAFTEDGGLNPDGGRDNFGLGGGHSFDMKNSGIEFGAGYAFNSQWTAGLLGGVSDGSLKPTRYA